MPNPNNISYPSICIADDRTTLEPGIRLLIASLSRYCADWPVELFVPAPTKELVTWLADYPNVSLNKLKFEGDWHGYNVKPQILMAVLGSGASSALWIDSDIIVMRPLLGVAASLDSGLLVITEEAMSANHYDGDALRARSWGLAVGRKLPFQLNTGVVGVTADHIPLLTAWREVLESPAYISAYHMPWTKRPSYFAGDQEVLTALLCDVKFSNIKISILRRGKDIIQYFGLAGYSVIERVRHILANPPMFIHAQGVKPWLVEHGLNKKGVKKFRGVGPYEFAALDYSDSLADSDWLSAIKSGAGRSWKSKAPLSGFGLSLVVDIFRMLRWGHTGGEPRKGNKAIDTYKELMRANGVNKP